jgi:endonuclease V-like protein UPF0215 family
MTAWPLKDKARIAGIDDGVYVRDSKLTPIAITISRMDGYIDGIILSKVETDGKDASFRIHEALMKSGHLDQVRAILIDGACLAGFNVIDLDDLHSRTDLPVITCSDEEPDTLSIKMALEQNFEDANERIEKIIAHEPSVVELPDGPCYIRCRGITPERAEWIIRKVTRMGRTPEPIRISHMIARSLRELDGVVDNG